MQQCHRMPHDMITASRGFSQRAFNWDDTLDYRSWKQFQWKIYITFDLNMGEAEVFSMIDNKILWLNRKEMTHSADLLSS